MNQRKLHHGQKKSALNHWSPLYKNVLTTERKDGKDEIRERNLHLVLRNSEFDICGEESLLALPLFFGTRCPF